MAQVSFVERVGNESPFGLPFVEDRIAIPTFVDIDGDNDLDLFLRGASSQVAYYENTGPATFAVYEERTGSANPMNNIGTIQTFQSRTQFFDVDGDNDYDLAFSNENQLIHYYENTGSTTTPNFIARTGSDNPFNGLSNIHTVHFLLEDLNNDGLVDVINSSRYYLNNGNGFDAEVGIPVALAVADIDNDGDKDIISRDSDGFQLYRNTNLTFNHVQSTTFNSIDIRWLSHFDTYYSTLVCLEDLDNDGDLDFIQGASTNGILTYHENIGLPTFPNYTMEVDFQNAFFGFTNRQDFNYDLGDINSDGLLDMVLGRVKWEHEHGTGSSTTTNLFFKNEGGLNAPKLNLQHQANNVNNGTKNPFSNLEFYTFNLLDWDNDNDLDIVSVSKYFENIGSSTTPNYQEIPNHPTLGLPQTQYCDFVDIDGDGDYDFFSSDEYYMFDNITQSYVLQSSSPLPAPWSFSRPNFVDFDGDNDYDCFITTAHEIHYFENIGDMTSPSFISSTNNPFLGANIIS